MDNKKLESRWSRYRHVLLLALFPTVWLFLTMIEVGMDVGLRKILVNTFSIVTPFFMVPVALVFVARNWVKQLQVGAVWLGGMFSAAFLAHTILTVYMAVGAAKADDPQPNWTFFLPATITSIIGVVLAIETARAYSAYRKLKSMPRGDV